MGLYDKSLEKYIESYRNLNSSKHAYSALEKPCAIENLFGKRILQIHQSKYLVCSTGWLVTSGINGKGTILTRKKKSKI